MPTSHIAYGDDMHMTGKAMRIPAQLLLCAYSHHELKKEDMHTRTIKHTVLADRPGVLPAGREEATAVARRQAAKTSMVVAERTRVRRQADRRRPAGRERSPRKSTSTVKTAEIKELLAAELT